MREWLLWDDHIQVLIYCRAVVTGHSRTIFCTFTINFQKGRTQFTVGVRACCFLASK